MDGVVVRDVMLRCRTRRDIRELAHFLVENMGREVSTRRLGNAFSLSHQTVNSYLDCLEGSYFFVLLKRFTGKTLEKYTLPKNRLLLESRQQNRREVIAGLPGIDDPARAIAAFAVW